MVILDMYNVQDAGGCRIQFAGETANELSSHCGRMDDSKLSMDTSQPHVIVDSTNRRDLLFTGIPIE